MSRISRRDRCEIALNFVAEIVSNGFRSAVSRRRDSLRQRLAKTLEGRKSTRLRPIKRLPADATQEIRQAHQAATPVVIEGLYEHWPARKQWSMEYFHEHFGERSFEVNVQNPHNRRTEFRELSLASIIDSFQDRDVLNYIMFSPIFRTIPELRQDIDLSVVRRFAALSERRKIWAKLFLGPAGTRTSLHMAPQSNLFFQIYGEKRWVMFPPSQSALIYPNRIFPKGLPYFFSDYGYSDEIGDPNFPLTDYLEGWDIYLKAGDALWIPPYHWHWVHALSPSISLSTWWYDPLITLRESPFFTLLSLPGLWGIMRGRYDIDEFDQERTQTIRERLQAHRDRKKAG